MTDDFAYLNEDELPFRFCPGCTHGIALRALTDALEKLRPDPMRTVAVSDIGCVGLSDRYLSFSTFHGLHGRSIAYAMGLKIARPELLVITLIGDGGVGIGAGHLVAAARRNVGICVLVFNNFNFGMTGGQHSVTTFTGGRTSTTPGGNIERPLDICKLASASGATFVARASGMDKSLPDILAKALEHPGFSLVDIWEVCTAHYMKANHFHKAELEQELSRKERGIIVEETAPEYAAQIHAQIPAERPPFDPLAPFRVRVSGDGTRLSEPRGIVIAGSAGMKIRYAASMLARAAVMSGLRAAQLDEFPITVLTGYSVSDVILSREPIHHLEREPADLLIVLSEEGRERFARRGRNARRVYRLSEVRAGGEAELVIAPAPGIRKEQIALYGIAHALQNEGILPAERLSEAIQTHGFRGNDSKDLDAQVRAVAAATS